MLNLRLLEDNSYLKQKGKNSQNIQRKDLMTSGRK